MSTSRRGLTKKQFLQRSKALALYRRILRDCKRIPDAQSRAETKRFVREDFERNRGVRDLVSGLLLAELHWGYQLDGCLRGCQSGWIGLLAANRLDRRRRFAI
jgi:hypothetical protein